MTTADRLRSYMGDREFDSTHLASLASRYWPVVLIIAMMAVAAGLRLWALGERAIHHDESIHIKFAWDITQVGVANYTHDPVYHGPLQYFGMAGTFFIFGDSDYTSRLLPALVGIALVGLPFLLRRQLGTIGVVTAAALLAVSPTLIYFSRFARNDIYVAFFTLAIVVCIWRYMEDRRDGWLIAIAPLLALSFASKEITLIIVAIFLVFLNVRLASDLVGRLNPSGKMTLQETSLAYTAIIPTAWLIAAVWPLVDGMRRRFSLTELPATGVLLVVFGTLVAAQYAPALQRLPFVEDNGYMGEGDLMRVAGLILILAGAYVGILWKWRVWLIAGVLFYAVFVLLYTSFFTNMGGFWTGIWGSMDYWLQQQGVRRGDQPDYYYFMLLPVYEFLPLVFALGGALYYALRGRMEQTLLAVAALLLVLVFSLIPDDTALIGEVRIQIAFVVALGAVIFLSIDTFTKFLLFWTLAILFGLTVAGEKMPWLAVHLALPVALLAARVLDGILSSAKLRAEPPPDADADTKGEILIERVAPFAGAGALGLASTALFISFGPASGTSVIAWLCAAAAVGVVAWTRVQVSWQAAGQVAAVGLFAALLIFTVRAGGTAAFDQGDPNGTPPEIFIYAQGSPALGVIRDNIEELARTSGRGKDLKIIIDNTGNIWPWPWYIRDYTNVQYDNFEDGFSPEPGSVVLVRTQNQSKMEPFLDQYSEGVPYTHMWWFPEFYKNLETGDFLTDVIDGTLLTTWRDFFIDRTVPNASASPDVIAYFPKEFSPVLPPPVSGTGTGVQLAPDLVTVIGGPGADPGSFAQPADIALDAEGNLYVVDTLNHRIQKIAVDGTVTTTGSSGTALGQFANPAEEIDDYDVADGPWGIGIDADGNVYVADTWNHRIQQFDDQLRVVGGWEIGDFFGPRDVAIDASGDLLVMDTGNKRLMIYTAERGLIRAFGGEGSGRAEFNEPSSVAVGPDGRIYIADYWNKRIQLFDSELLYIGEIEVDSWGSPGITDRAYIAPLSDGRVLATDPANSRIIVFNPAGEEESAWSLPTASGTSRPIGIAVNEADGLVYISDSLSSQVVQVPLSALLTPQIEE